MVQNYFSSILNEEKESLLQGWLAAIPKNGLIKAEDLKRQCQEVLTHLAKAVQQGAEADIATPMWEAMRALLGEISASRAIQGFTTSGTARFVLSLKAPAFAALRKRFATLAADLANSLEQVTLVVDNLALYTTEAFMKTREDLIRRQAESMLELSTPVVKLWDGILALPLIGTLDSARTQIVMESLLQRVVAESTEVVIIDITGVPTVDTLVAQHLLKTVTAARLMGTDCIISGIRPQIAQTIVHLGVDLTSVVTKSSLADAFKVALTRRELAVVRRRPLPGSSAATSTSGRTPTATA
jgi:rsbT co-antagonist protein RsbR